MRRGFLFLALFTGKECDGEMGLDRKIVAFSVDHPRLITLAMVLVTLLLGLQIRNVKVDTDPENMLSKDEAVRVFHNRMKKVFQLHDMVVLGVVNEKDPDGVFNPDSLTKIYELTQYAETLKWPDPEHPGKEMGVIEADIIAPSTVDNIEQAGLGTVRFEWLMAKPPKTREEALKIRDAARSNPMLNGTLLSEDGKAICIYLPLTRKDLSHRVYTALKKKIATFKGDEKYYITGLPVAEDVFGVEMFVQMAISAPLAMLVIFILMYVFFRKIVLIASPMILAVMCVISTMGLLIGMGYTVHIMSSMIPIFIMPIAVLDSIHILSEFFDRYQATRDRRKTIFKVMEELFVPMLYTSLTSAAGFASLALTPIPPVQVFGVFVAIGIMLAWIWTVTFIPAYTMFISEKSLEDFGARKAEGKSGGDEEGNDPISRVLSWMGALTYTRAKTILALTVLAAGVAAYGISLIQINDNPVKWFTKSHEIRIADEVLNSHFGGTYMAYLVLEPEEGMKRLDDVVAGLNRELNLMKPRLVKEYGAGVAALLDYVAALIEKTGAEFASREGGDPAEVRSRFFRKLAAAIEKKKDDENLGDDEYDALEDISAALDAYRQRVEVFKRPDLLRYIEGLQKTLLDTKVVGKSNSVVDIVKKVHQELFEGRKDHFRVPDTEAAVAQCLISFQNSHDPDDLWHLVTPDYRKANIWVQLKSGDNKDMEYVARKVDEYFASHRPPVPLKHRWFGLTYINVVWQDKMVSGMLQAFLGSFLVVFVMMAVLFDSALWGILSMLPLTVTIAFIYGVIGLVGKDYDMPVAVLSSLTLGLAVDFAIHFLSRTRNLIRRYGDWPTAVPHVFGEPARAITRNVIVIAVGFLPLLAAPLVPYKTVGFFLASILSVAGVGTLFILPALVTVLADKLFSPEVMGGTVTCKCTTCVITSFAAVLLVAVNVHQYASVEWNTLAKVAIVAVPLLAGVCSMLARRSSCAAAGENRGAGE